MLKNIDPLLGPELLMYLRAMGHGDEIVIVDANYPAMSGNDRVARLDGISSPQALRAILSVLPLDQFVDCAAFYMQVVGDPAARPPIIEEFADIIRELSPDRPAFEGIERFAFYERARSAFALVATGEGRPYGNVILKKGIIVTDTAGPIGWSV